MPLVKLDASDEKISHIFFTPAFESCFDIIAEISVLLRCFVLDLATKTKSYPPLIDGRFSLKDDPSRAVSFNRIADLLTCGNTHTTNSRAVIP